MRKILYAGLIALALQPFMAGAQDAPGGGGNRSEWTLGLGASQFLGDVGGSSGVGTHFLGDWNGGAMKLAGMLAYTYHMDGPWAIRGAVSVAELYGSDALSGNPWRHNRNITFRDIIVEPAVEAEYYILQQNHSGKHYNIKGAGGSKNTPFDLFIFGGIGAVYYNPQGEFTDNTQNPYFAPAEAAGATVGKWYNLRDLHTEGEGMYQGPGEYGDFAVTIPVGVGFNFNFSPKMGLGIEISDRLWTSTDFLDDVSGNYYDASTINQKYGAIAAYFSNPQLSNPAIGEQGQAGQQRGDPGHNDSYMFVMLTLHYHPFHGGGASNKAKL